jgi:diaminopimelate epimerase
MWNADGSAGEMCGNGIRCVAKFLYERRKLQQDVLHIATDGGIRRLELIVQHRQVQQVRVNMGRPVLQAEMIPTTLPGAPPLNVMLPIIDSPIAGMNQIAVNAISMGNPHCVAFVEDLSDQLVHGVGPLIEHHPAFPNRVNAEFVQLVSPQKFNMRVWERGSGETEACGSGACAALVAGVLTGRTEPTATCHLPGGELQLEWRDRKDVYMTGPAVEVFSGEWPMEDLEDRE